MKFISYKILFIFLAISVLFLSSCATYYQRNQKFQESVAQGNFDEAQKIITKSEKDKKGKNKLLYYFNAGWISYMLGNYAESNIAFEEADKIIEDQMKNYGLEALTLISNPNVKPYNAEDFEKVMVNFYKSMNYLLLNDYENSLVECKKINIKLNNLNDKYKDHKNRYQNDAFAQVIMGLIYDATHDYNNAFIAYRNALEVYESDYLQNFEIKVPEQLKQDILRTAYLTGFYDEVAFYENKFNTKYKYQPNEGGTLVFFWENGFGPVKAEWSLNFTKTTGIDGFVTIADEDVGLSFPYNMSDVPENERAAFSDLSMMRIAFPKYIERKPVFSSAEIITQNKTYTIETAENINAIAFKTLHDRMLREMASSLLRLATKKAMEAAARKQNENLGTAVSIVNAITEKADTRNWQTLPYSIGYSRIELPAGEQQVSLKCVGENQQQFAKDFTFQINKGKTTFFMFHNLESYQ